MFFLTGDGCINNVNARGLSRWLDQNVFYVAT